MASEGTIMNIAPWVDGQPPVFVFLESHVIPKGPAKITFSGEFGTIGAGDADMTIFLQESVNSVWVQMLDDDEPIIYTASNSSLFNIHAGDLVRFKIQDTRSDTVIHWSITYN